MVIGITIQSVTHQCEARNDLDHQMLRGATTRTIHGRATPLGISSIDHRPLLVWTTLNQSPHGCSMHWITSVSPCLDGVTCAGNIYRCVCTCVRNHLLLKKSTCNRDGLPAGPREASATGGRRRRCQLEKKKMCG